MFNFFKKKEEKPKPVPVDLNITSMNLSNKLNETSLKVNAIDKELKAQLQIYRNERNPTRKAQAKKKATQLLKKKKMYEQHINNLSNTQMTVDSTNMDCQIMKDNMNINIATLKWLAYCENENTKRTLIKYFEKKFNQQ